MFPYKEEGGGSGFPPSPVVVPWPKTPRKSAFGGGGGSGGTGPPPSAINVRNGLGGRGGTGPPPSAGNVFRKGFGGNGGTGPPPSTRLARRPGPQEFLPRFGRSVDEQNKQGTQL